MEHITIKDIAKALNLSFSTVSRALRGHPDVNQETKKKILALAEQLNYEKNPLALSLRKQKTNAIGVIIPEIANPFFSRIISGIQHVAYEAGYNVMICLSDESIEREISNLRHLLRYRVDGLLAAVSVETSTFPHFELALAKQVPMVFIDRVWDHPQVSKVLVDDFEGAFTITQHLIEMGYGQIAHIAGPEKLLVTQKRLEGFRAAILAHDLPLPPDYIQFGGFTEDFGAEALQKLLSLPSPPDAVFCVNDRTATGALLHCKTQQVQVPRQLGIAGFTDMPVSKLIEPGLTTMAQPAFEMGEVATQMMLRYLAAERYEPEVLILKTQLIIRESTRRSII
ncbi:MAG: LacI family transcriptional regulator [Microscillaceae bacterium]|nr:LacI family transcriptional regulator [Microscillaceae bacterium]